MDSDYNQDRVNRARQAIQDYKVDTEGADAVTDLLADLRHFCTARGFDFETCNRLAGEHYQIEVESAKSDGANRLADKYSE